MVTDLFFQQPFFNRLHDCDRKGVRLTIFLLPPTNTGACAASFFTSYKWKQRNSQDRLIVTCKSRRILQLAAMATKIYIV
jgi:hypothetical protein